MHSATFIVVVAATILAVNVIAFVRRANDPRRFRTYFADPDYHRPFPILLSTIGTIVGGGMFLAVGQIGFEAGVTGIVIGVAYVVGFSLLGVFAPTFRRVLESHKADTLIELLEACYSRRVAIQFSVVSAAMYFFLLAGQFVALHEFAVYAQALCAHTWMPWALVGLGAGSMLVYPVIGGLRKDISTDIVQVLLVVFGTLVLVRGFLADPLSGSMWGKLPTEHLSGMGSPDKGYGILFLVGVLIFVPGMFLVRNDLWQRIRASRDATRLKSTFIAAGVVSCLFYVVFTLIGMWAQATGTSQAKTATLDMMVRSVQDPVILGLVVGAFFAAILSSADTFINNASGFLARVCFPGAWERREQKEGDRTLIIWSRSFAIAVTIVGALLGWVAADIVDLLVGAFSLLLIYLPVVLGTFVPAWRNERSAFVSPAAGVAVFVALFFLWNAKMAFAPAVLISITLFAVIGASRPKAVREGPTAPPPES
ncbi:MAG: hypothetical protein KBG29_01255 [Pseudomonadales bacterium]|nr:hypothetical protein [Pseudomonadales bacterium]